MDGILIIDKPTGMTSHDVVYKARRALMEKRIGHTGTLDPLATGVLVLCVGRATKLVKYFTEHDKRYEAELVLGYATDTLDTEGTILRRMKCPIIPESLVDETLKTFVGPQLQLPPLYSAIKVDGKKLYEYARKDQEVPDLAPRPVEVHSISRSSPVVFREEEAHFSLSLHCGKGFYVRSLVRDLGERLGIPATLTGLRRTSVGEFTLLDAVRLENVSPAVPLLNPFEYLKMPVLSVDSEIQKKVLNGVFLSTDLFPSTEETVLVDPNKIPLAIYTYDERIDKMRLSVMW